MSVDNQSGSRYFPVGCEQTTKEIMLVPQKPKAKTTTRRTKVKDLPKSKKQLAGKDLKKIKGGIIAVRKAGEKPVEY